MEKKPSEDVAIAHEHKFVNDSEVGDLGQISRGHKLERDGLNVATRLCS